MEYRHISHFRKNAFIALLTLMMVSSLFMFTGCDLLCPLAKYSVSYNGNGNTGGGVPSDSAKYASGASVTVPGNTGSLVRTGFTFAGWNTQADGAGVDRVAGSTFSMPAANLTLYAWWTPLALTMISVPGGSFTMGSATGGDDNERPAHTETVTAFLMSKFEVSQAQFSSVTGYSSSSYSAVSLAPAQPVVEVTWFDAVEFCNLLSIRDGYTPLYTITDRNPASGYPIHWATVAQDTTKNGYRLPMEAEWEYAARGGSGSPGGYTYSGSNDIDTVAWYSLNASSLPHPVGRKAANALGICDMSGNVWEWCWDLYGSYSPDPPAGSRTATEYRVNRGGGWHSIAANCRSATRFQMDVTKGIDEVGFRVVRRTHPVV